MSRRNSPANLYLLLMAAAWCLLPMGATGEAPYRMAQQWSAADGLPAETVASLAIDEEGRLWMATYDGVVRYQGFDFRHFNRHSDPPLPSNRAMALYPAPGYGVVVQFEDGRFGHLDDGGYRPIGKAGADAIAVFAGQIWFIDAHRGNLWSWAPIDGARPRPESDVAALAVDSFGDRLLLGTNSGAVLVLESGAGQSRQLVPPGQLGILGIAAGPAGEILILDGEQAYLANVSDRLSRGKTLAEWPRTQTRLFRATWTERGWLIANLFTARGVGPHLLDESGILALDGTEVTSIDADRSPVRIERFGSQGRRWVNQGQQLFRDGRLMFASEERIRDFIVDAYDQIWIAQPTGGLRLLKQSVMQALGTRDGELPDPNVSLVTEIEGELFIGSWVALSRFDPATGSWTQLLERAARDILADGDALLVGSHGLCRLEAPGECIEVVDYPGGRGEIRLLHRDQHGAVWAGSEAGLFRRTPEGQWQPQAIDRAMVRTALEAASGRLLLGTSGDGLLVLSVHDGPDFGISRIGPTEGLSSAFVRALLPVTDGRTLVGTEDAGLCLLGAELDIIRCLSSDGGLPHHSVHKMLVDAEQRMWVNTNAGIYRVDLLELLAYLQGQSSQVPAFARFGVRQGMPSIEGNGGVYRAGTQTAEGRIWFPNQLGVVVIQTDQDPLQPTLALTPRIRILDPPHEARQPLQLPRHARHIELELVATALAEPQNVQFRYRFSSAEDWQDLGFQRRLSFRALPPGQHQLQVMARHIDTSWSGEPAILAFSAGYRTHEHPLFHAALVSLVLLGAYWLWHIMRRRQRTLEHAVEERSEQLGKATRQLTQLTQALDQVDLQHRTALQAVSHELKAALDTALAPLRQMKGKPVPAGKAKQIRVQARTVDALIEQLGRFSEPESNSTESPRDQLKHKASRSSINGKGAAETAADLEARIRMEVLLHLGDPEFSVEQLAKGLGMSRSVMYRRVAEFHTGRPAELIRDLRLDQAARLLTETDQQISSVAFATGFQSVSTFSRAFRKKTGVSPRQWREKNPAAPAGQNPAGTRHH